MPKSIEPTPKERLLVAVALSVGAAIQENNPANLLNNTDGLAFAVNMLLTLASNAETHDAKIGALACFIVDEWKAGQQ